MSTAPAPLQPTNAPAQQADDPQYYRAVLHELIDMGTDLARSIHHQATQQPARKPPTPGSPANDSNPAPNLTPNLTPDPTVAFDRIARCVRRSIALARTLTEPPRPAPHPAQHQPGQHRTAARKRIIRAVEDVIHRRATGPRAESLHAELQERLDAPDLEDDLSSRPAAEIIAEICKDLGLADMPGAHPCKRRTPADIANLYARAAQQPGPAQQPTPARQPAPTPPPARLPSDPAEAVAHILRHAARIQRE